MLFIPCYFFLCLKCAFALRYDRSWMKISKHFKIFLIVSIISYHFNGDVSHYGVLHRLCIYFIFQIESYKTNWSFVNSLSQSKFINHSKVSWNNFTENNSWASCRRTFWCTFWSLTTAKKNLIRVTWHWEKLSSHENVHLQEHITVASGITGL